MKKMKINDNVSLKLDDDSESFSVVIDNPTKKVVDYHSDFTQISKDDIQKLVNKLLRLKMITLQGKNTDTTEVDINIWDVDGDGKLWIEVFHTVTDEDGNYEPCDDDRLMLYDDFLNS